MGRICIATMVCLAVGSLSPAGARAAYDMSGRWGLNSVQHHWDVMQNSGELTITDDSPAWWPTLTGTVDETTGEFVIDVPPTYPGCGTNSLHGTVAADSLTFTASLQYWSISGGTPTLPPHCIDVHATLAGNRCGNGELGAGEDCDDGDALSGDCCSSTCTLDSEGTACTDDFDICTDDVCDGSGSCEHVDNTAPCSDAFGCGTGNCAADACVIHSPAPAGTACNRDESVCTVDTCDGSGSCATGATVDCAPCGFCDNAAGCVVSSTGCDTNYGTLDLAVKLGGNHLKGALNVGSPASDLGDPTLTTEYTLCLGEIDESGSRSFFQATVPAAGTCGDAPCWQASDEKFLYKNKTPDNGITQLRIDLPQNSAFQHIAFRGRGTALPLPATFADDLDYLAAKVIASDGMSSKCWYHVVAPDKLTSVKFRGFWSANQVNPE